MVLYIVLYNALHHWMPYCEVRKAASIIAYCHLKTPSRLPESG